MEWGIAINLREPVSEIIEKAKVADVGGIETIWITDFPAIRLSPVLASIVAENTENSKIGVGLISPFIYSTAHILQMMTTLIETHGDRFDLLLGPGDRVKLGEIGVSYGEVSTLVARMSNVATSIREGLSEYKECRVIMGAQGPKMIASSICSDGILLNYSDPEMIRWAITLLEDRPRGFRIGVFPPSLIDTSNSCSEHRSIKTSAAVVALGLSRSIMKRFRLIEDLQPALEMMKLHGLTNEVIDMINQNILDRFSLCGSIESIIERLMGYQRLGVDMVVYGPPLGSSLKGVKLLVDAKNRL